MKNNKIENQTKQYLQSSKVIINTSRITNIENQAEKIKRYTLEINNPYVRVHGDIKVIRFFKTNGKHLSDCYISIIKSKINEL